MGPTTRRKGRWWGAALTALVLVAGVVTTAGIGSAAVGSSAAEAAVPGAAVAGAAVPAAVVASATPPALGPHTGTAGPGAPGSRFGGTASDTPIGPAAVAGELAATAPSTASAAAASASLAGWLHADGATLEKADGSPYVIKGVAWFGMETSNCAPHGLWTISLDAGLAQIASMGFNTIRLPFSSECLAASASNSINAGVNPTLVSLSPLELMDQVVQRAKAYGLNVILDRHRPDSGAQSELWYTAQYSEESWIADWTMLARRYLAEPTVIGVDLHNEPHGQACWGCGDPARDWQAAATRAGDAVQAVNPQLLIVVEGVEKQGDGSSTWWGGGLADAGSDPVELSVPGQVVYSPHDYPASIFAQKWFSASDYPANLPAVWTGNWGYLATENIAPVLVGEFGSKLETASDRAWFETMVSYLKTTGISFAYWSFNPNSGDTGGLVKDDWVTPQAEKVAALAPLIGSGTSVPVQTPAPGTSPSPTKTPAAPWLTPVSPIPGTARPGPPGPSQAPSSPVPAPSTSPGSPSTPPGSPSAGQGGSSQGTPSPSSSSAGGSGSLSATWTAQSQWDTGYIAQIVLTNTGSSTGWRISWPDAGATSVVNAWGMDCQVASRTVTCTGSQWATPVASGQSVTVGLQVVSTAAPYRPALTLESR
ncbi:cellulase family glycosylhydrolase [Herbiconiux solani]|uniref:cellulase family glycosylhydrolase n=1 Tax=Herbiconiux solani TaxID=661329 RepID=UPI000A7C1A07|nr:cellulase family glycosylhydrolase [Herbiconiux solani]